MNNQDILMLLTYINSFDATITVDQARVLAWAELLPKHITYPQAKEAATLQLFNQALSPANAEFNFHSCL